MTLLFPARCFAGHLSEVVGPGGFCPRCQEELQRERAEPACPRCAATVNAITRNDPDCRACRDQKSRIDALARVAQYRGVFATVIRDYKYHGRERLLPHLARWMTDAISATPWLPRVQAVVPVPTHWKHRLKRPLYAAERLADDVARRLNLPSTPVLRRIRAGPHQIGLSYTERQKNVSGAFQVPHHIALRDARLLLIDDVKTTGATLEECAKMLRRAGASEIYAAVAALVDWSGPSGQPIAAI
jgi:competence protein ComFC